MKRFFLLFCLLGLSSACKEKKSLEEKVVPVTVMEVQDVQSFYTRNYLGTVVTKHHRTLHTLYAGTVVELKVRVGEKVTKNQLLAVVDAPTVNSMKKTSDATLAQARDGYERARKVYEAGGLSEIKWMDVQTKLTQAESAAAMADDMQENCRIKAPWDATVSEVFVTLGDELSPMARMVSLIDENHLEVTIGIPESEFSKVREGMAARVVIPALDYLELKAKIDEIEVQASPVSHSYLARLICENQPVSLKAGMACKVNLETDNCSRVIVPASVIKVDDRGRYVWLADENDRVVKRHITSGGFSGTGVVIAGGVDVGERIIVEGGSKVSTGMKVLPTTVDAL